MTTPLEQYLPDGFQGKLIRHAPLAGYTTFRVGGPASSLWDIARGEDLRTLIHLCQTRHLPFHLLGGGSNVVIDDAGLDNVIVFRTSEAAIRHENGRLLVSAGVALDACARFCTEEGLSGLSFAAGIPGTVGGAIVGNAGAFGRQVADCLENIDIVNEQGEVETWDASRLGFAYRHSVLKTHPRPVLSAVFRVTPGDKGALREERTQTLALRHDKHPDLECLPSAGSFFQNVEPKSGAERRQAAGYWLEQAGAKGFREGGAAVFENHANMIVNTGGATAKDILTLAKRMRDAVLQQFGISLLREVRTLPDALGADLPTSRDARQEEVSG